MCRRIDCVVLVGKKEPTLLYAWDMWLGTPERQGATCHVLSPLSVLNRSGKHASGGGVENGIDLAPPMPPRPFYATEELLNPVGVCGGKSREELQQMFEPWQYCDLFSTAFDAYQDGRWPVARSILDRCLAIVPNDGPAIALRLVIEKTGFNAPEGWKGFRSLTEK